MSCQCSECDHCGLRRPIADNHSACALDDCRRKKEISKKEAEWSKGNKMWLTGAGLATVAYFMLSGQYITIATDSGYDDEDDGDIE